MSGPLRTEADLVRTLKAGTYTLAELYRRVEDTGLADRPGGRAIIQDGQAKEATTAGEPGWSVLDPDQVYSYLHRLRGELREEKREQLQEAAEQLATVTGQRDALIREIRGWGDDSLRTIAVYAGVSHTEVKRIADAMPDSTPTST